MSERNDSDPRPRPGGKPRADRLGKLLPETTRDEWATEWGDAEPADPDERLRREVPPHHT